MPGELRIGRVKGEPIKPGELSDGDGEFLVRLARKSVEYYLDKGRLMGLPEDVPPKLLRPGAAFVTIERVGESGSRELRGCIGAIRPVEPLAVTVIKTSVESAIGDPRFPPMDKRELDTVVFEVTVLGPLEPLPRDPRHRLRSFEIGVHGLYVEKPPYAGILLPQVAVEEGWDQTLFLTWTCIKAGLPGTCWLRSDVKVYKFEAAIWAEREPRGPVYRRVLKGA
ncbi:MAG: TIGR00296 family protein [Desulfurococcales archaeon]|nr:TIGR00296 family protein [Desulfurococcales archaeon]